MLHNHFSLDELFANCSIDEVLKAIKDVQITENLLSLNQALNHVRETLGAPIKVNSAYRDGAHNRRVGGVPNSHHLRGSAADITSADNSELYKSILANKHLFGQCGYYYHGSKLVWIHVSLPCEKYPTYKEYVEQLKK